MQKIKDISKSKPEKTLHIYIRVSTEVQKTDGASLETQLNSGIRIAKQNKMDYMVWDEGAKSGSKNIKDRIVFNNLMYEVRNGNVSHIFFFDISRAQRDYEYEYVLLKTCKDYSCKLYDINKVYDLDSPTDSIFIRIQSMFVQFENQQRRMKSVLGKRDHFLRGGWRGGTPPFGFDTIERKLVINKDEGKWVQKIFKLYADGKTSPYISNLLFTNKVKPRRSKSGIFNIGTINVMLKNEIYIGIDRMKDTDEPEKILVYKGIPKIVEQKIFNLVQKKLEENQRIRKPHTNTFPTLLRKMVWCHSCGELWGVRHQYSKGSHVYYCRNRENKWGNRTPNRKIPKCEVKRSANIKHLDELVWNSIIKLNDESHILKQKDKNLILQPINSNKSRSWKQRRNYLEKEITKLEEKKSFMYQQFIADEIDKKMLDELNKQIKNQISENENEIRDLDTNLKHKKDKDGFIDWVKTRQKKISNMSKITDDKKKEDIIIEFVV